MELWLVYTHNKIVVAVRASVQERLCLWFETRTNRTFIVYLSQMAMVVHENRFSVIQVMVIQERKVNQWNLDWVVDTVLWDVSPLSSLVHHWNIFKYQCPSVQLFLQTENLYPYVRQRNWTLGVQNPEAKYQCCAVLLCHLKLEFRVFAI